jgi:CxxC-x17-CxxC domain-containing protein
MADDITFLGATDFRGEEHRFGIKQADRRQHFYVVGKTGMGKSELLKNMAIQDIQNGHGLGFIDPHGETVASLLDFIPSHRINDVIYFNPSDMKNPVAFNVMEQVPAEMRHLVASGLMGAFKKMWPDVWSARMEYILNYAILALLEHPGTTLLGINRLLADAKYREKIIERVSDPVVKSFWTKEFARYSERYESEATAAIQNKIGQLISAPLIRGIIGQVKTSIDIREAMDSGKILLVNLSKGKVGEDASSLLGALIVTKLQIAAMSRVDIPEQDRRDFYLYVDEFQNFATKSFTNIFSEARKYRLNLIITHQYVTQMEESIRDAVFGNVGTLACFRVGAEDAEYLEKEFAPDFQALNLVNLDKYNIYIKLMINGLANRTFSAHTLPPRPIPEKNHREKIITVSRERYGTPYKKVEEKIGRWMEEISVDATPSTKELHDAVCDECGKDFKLSFKPVAGRLYYCKSCLKQMAKEEGIEEEGASKTGYREVIKRIVDRSVRKKNGPKIIRPNQTVNLDD